MGQGFACATAWSPAVGVPASSAAAAAAVPRAGARWRAAPALQRGSPSAVGVSAAFAVGLAAVARGRRKRQTRRPRTSSAAPAVARCARPTEEEWLGDQGWGGAAGEAWKQAAKEVQGVPGRLGRGSAASSADAYDDQDEGFDENDQAGERPERRPRRDDREKMSRPSSASLTRKGIPIAGLEGNWQCPRCKNVNFATRFNCNRCAATKPSEMDLTEQEAERTAAFYENEGRDEDFEEEDEESEEEEEVEEDVDPEEVIFGSRKPFGQLGIMDERLLAALPKLGFTGSTRVQAASVPLILSEDRRAVVLNAETGSGKTLAYLLPAFELCLREKPREAECSSPTVLILVPGRELGYQVQMVARQIASQILGRKISVYSARTGWPENVPDILITTPRAAAQGLSSSLSSDEIARRQALARIKGVELLVLDEADMLLGGGCATNDVRTLLTALAAAYPDKKREVLAEAQVFYKGGVPVEVLDDHTLEWKEGKAQWNNDGTYNVMTEPGTWLKYVRRSNIKGPGIALFVENGPRVVLASATLPTNKNSIYREGARQGVQDHSLYNSGIGSPDWVIKRWFPNAVRIESEWIHRKHPGIVQQEWVHILGEKKNGEKRNFERRLRELVRVMKEEGPGVRTLVFANTPEACLAAEVSLKGENISCAGIHAGLPFEERIDALKQFAKGQVNVLLCTDVAARGIDLPLCRHVVQLEFARNAVEHLHRVGRAARAGRTSKTTSFWGEGDISVKDAILRAPSMGLSGDLLCRRGNRCRLRRTRKKQRKQEFAYMEIREKAREARVHTTR